MSQNICIEFEAPGSLTYQVKPKSGVSETGQLFTLGYAETYLF